MCCPPITTQYDCGMVPTVDADTCTINLPPALIAHRRRPFPVHGRVLVLPGAWQPILDHFDDVVMDSSLAAGGPAMCPATPDNVIVLPCPGYWQIKGGGAFYGAAPGTTLGLVVVVNSVMQNYVFWPAPSGNESAGWAEITQRYNAGDQVSMMAWSEEPGGTLSGSFDLIVEWKGK